MGFAVGRYECDYANPGTYQYGVWEYDIQTGIATILGLPPNDAHGNQLVLMPFISPGGRIIAAAGTFGSDPNYLVDWTNGVWSVGADLAVACHSSAVQISAVNDAGAVAGICMGSSSQHSFMWNGAFHSIRDDGIANAISGDGKVFGEYGYYLDSGAFGYMWDGSVHNLNDLVIPSEPANLEIYSAAAVSSSGMIAASAHNPSSFAGPWSLILLTPSSCASENNVLDGYWDFGGCFVVKHKTEYDTTKPANLDGLVITPAPKQQLDISDAGGTSDNVVSSSASVALNASKLGAPALAQCQGAQQSRLATDPPGNDLIPLMAGELKIGLNTKQTQITVPKGTTIYGIPIDGAVTLTPAKGGAVSGAIHTDLPGILGGGKATLTFASTYGSGLTKVQLTADKGTLGQLFTLTKPTLTYDSGEWSASATATDSAGHSADLSGNLTYDKCGQVASGDVKVSNLTLAGIITIKKFEISYTNTKKKAGWLGNVQLEQGGQKAEVKLAFDLKGNLTSGDFHAESVYIFQLLELKTFDLGYDPKTGWKLAVTTTLPKGGMGSATLEVKDGAIQAASLTIDNVSLGGKLTIDRVLLSYSFAAGKPVDKRIYEGAAVVTLPGPAAKEVSGYFRFVNGSFDSGSLTISGLTIPIGYGVFLDRLGAKISTKPWELGGEVGLTVGPNTSLGKPVGLDGTLSYRWPGGGFPDKWDMTGELDIGSTRIGSGEIAITGGAATVSMVLGQGDGSEGLHLGKLATLHGTAIGTFTPTSIAATGHADFTISKYKIAG
ncbi:MAG TPA: hypothetical protein VG815_13610, partial [Chloroflexota bacterium]|nr:hypothetical protein [Chloroflexota bacterium]